MDMLRHERITLLSPEKWHDRNDRHTMEIYAQQRDIPSVLAYCMTEAPETAHHWQVFAGHSFGACVVFKKAEFLEHIRKRPELRCESVEYWTLERLERDGPVPIDRLPFIKRSAFQDEREVRLIADEAAMFEGSTLSVSIRIGLINRVIFSPFAVRALVDTAKDVMLGFEGCGSLPFMASALMDNKKWRRETEKSRVAL